MSEPIQGTEGGEAKELTPIFFKPFEVDKPAWGTGGKEIWFANMKEQNYCGKIMKFGKGAKFSNHFHKTKDEVQYVLSGGGIFRYYDLVNAKTIEREFKEGDCVHIEPSTPHQFEATEDTILLEVSTYHDNKDSYRLSR